MQHYREGENGHCWPSTVSNDDYESHPEQCPLGKYVFNATKYVFDFFLVAIVWACEICDITV